MARLTTSPSPVPGGACWPTPPAVLEPRKNALNTRASSPAGMPTPESATSSCQPAGAGRARTVTEPPAGVNFSALFTRLSRTWWTRVSSQVSLGPVDRLHHQPQAGGLGGGQPLGDRGADQVGQAHRRRAQLQRARLQPGQQQQVLDEA